VVLAELVIGTVTDKVITGCVCDFHEVTYYGRSAG
jgi:hypothetical protein